jgi:CRP-like cAMP-binding protein
VVRDGKHVTTIKTPGAVIGEMSVLLDVPQTATVRAVSEVEFFVIDNAIEVLRQHPDWLMQIARLLAQRVNATTAQLTKPNPRVMAVHARRTDAEPPVTTVGHRRFAMLLQSRKRQPAAGGVARPSSTSVDSVRARIDASWSRAVTPFGL